MNGKLYAIGVGPGDPELLTLKAVKTIRTADVIACPAAGNNPGIAFQIAEKAVPEISGKEILLLDFPMAKSGLSGAHLNAAERIILQLAEGNNVAFLTLGDPGFYSKFFYISAIVAQSGYEIEIISGIPSFCAVSAKLQLPLSLGKEPVLVSAGEWTDFPGTLVIMKAGSRLKALKEKIRASGKTAYLVENCGMRDEKIYSGINAIPDEAGYLSIMIVR